MRLIINGAFWLGLYAFIVLLPLVVGAVFISSGDAAGFSVALADALGYLGLALMAFELALVTRTNGAAGAFGEDALLQFHREIGIAALLLVLAHPVLLILSRAYPVAILWLGGGMAWPVWMGTVAFIAVLLVVGLSLLRKRLRSPYELWQATHGVLAMALVATAVIHILAVGRFAAMPVMQALWAVYLLVFIGLFLRYRLFRPLRLWSLPWEVVENRPERGNARTVVVKPKGHRGFTAEPGQFAWIGFGRTPFAMTQHPICIASANDADQPGDEVSFTIKALGDWSGKAVPRVKPGATAWVDGPHGVFTIDREEGAGYGLIGGGVGITPLRSMLLALEERGDVRPVVLFYGVTNEADLTVRRGARRAGPAHGQPHRRACALQARRRLDRRARLHQRGHPEAASAGAPPQALPVLRLRTERAHGRDGEGAAADRRPSRPRAHRTLRHGLR